MWLSRRKDRRYIAVYNLFGSVELPKPKKAIVRRRAYVRDMQTKEVILTATRREARELAAYCNLATQGSLLRLDVAGLLLSLVGDLGSQPNSPITNERLERARHLLLAAQETGQLLPLDLDTLMDVIDAQLRRQSPARV